MTKKFLRLLAALPCVALAPGASLAQAVVVAYNVGPGNGPAPPYACGTNYYVNDATGADSNNGTQATPGAGANGPWKTFGHADSVLTGAAGGICIQVAPGTYAQPYGYTLAHGGASAAANGWVFYHCQGAPGTCIVTVPAESYSQNVLVLSGANFIGFDGFTFDGNPGITGGYATVCLMVNSAAAAPAHHVMLWNNVFQNCGAAGVSLNNLEYFYAFYNRIQNNGFTGNPQSSGMTVGYQQGIDSGCTGACVANPVYTPSGLDLTFYPAYHNVYFGNVFSGNQIRVTAANPCNTHTDGNGFIIDTNVIAGQFYGYQTLVAYNLTYNNGGSGIRLLAANNVTVANNTSYADNTDLCYGPYVGPEAGIQVHGQKIVTVNNIVYAQQTTPSGDGAANPGGMVVPLMTGTTGYDEATDSNLTFAGNVLYSTAGTTGLSTNYGAGQPVVGGSYAGSISCTANKCNTNPGLSGPPANFAAPGGPGVGFGVTYTGAPATYADAGAFYHTLAQGGP